MSNLTRAAILGVSLFAAGCGSRPAPAVAPALPPAPPLDPTAADVVENSQYRDWSAFPVGTTLTQRTTTDSLKTPGMTVTTIIYTLKEKADSHLVVEWQASTEYHGGRVDRNPPVTERRPRWVKLAEGVKKEEYGKPAGKGETAEMTMAGIKCRCSVHKSSSRTDAGAMTTTTWSSADMPGGLVKAVSLVPAVEETTTIEVTALVIPS